MTTLIETVREIIERVADTSAGNLRGHVVSLPPNPMFGDVSSNLALVLAKHVSGQPLTLANDLVEKLKHHADFARVTVAPPGFLNITLSSAALARAIAHAVKPGYGANDRFKSKKARVEFVSANPTGPLHIGNARGGPLGDTIANVLAANGYKVLREYINNNRGNQIKELGKSLAGQGTQYQGEYLQDLKQKISNVTDPHQAGMKAVEVMFKEIIDDCRAMGVSFDRVVHESELDEQAGAVLTELDKKGLLKKKDGATWFAPKDDFLKDKDAVIVKSDGSYLYFTADVVYHKEKFESGYDLVVDVFGSNTVGHVPKLRALASIYGFDQHKFKVILYQFVRVKRGQEMVKMSKRAGTFVTAREVLEEVGKDAFRFFMLLHDANTHMDFDLELAKKQSKDNPVYYVQYAIARIHSILAKVTRSERVKSAELRVNDLEFDNPKIRQLVLGLTAYPDLVADLGATLEVHRLSHYAMKTASLFHDFYESVPVLKSEGAKREALLGLCRVSMNVLEHCLTLMGVSAPEKM